MAFSRENYKKQTEFPREERKLNHKKWNKCLLLQEIYVTMKKT